MSNSPLRNRLRSFRLERCITQQALARGAGVSRQTIIAIEKERLTPSVKLALKIAAKLDLPVEEIFWLEMGPEEEQPFGYRSGR